MAPKLKNGKRTTTPVFLNKTLTDAQQAIANQPIPSHPPNENAQSESEPFPAHETIAKRAYELYQQESVDGHALDHWLEAERQLSPP